MIVVNTGSVGLPYDGDRRASYLLIDDSKPEIRRVEYDMDRELGALSCVSRTGFCGGCRLAQATASRSALKPATF
jgi:diadenosine tetraphosphatase ApaH/serine/threonine PP2A family protein phosphatase